MFDDGEYVKPQFGFGKALFTFGAAVAAVAVAVSFQNCARPTEGTSSEASSARVLPTENDATLEAGEMRATSLTSGDVDSLKALLTDVKLCSDDSTCAVYLKASVSLAFRPKQSGQGYLIVRFTGAGIEPGTGFALSMGVASINNSEGFEGRSYLAEVNRLVQFQVADGTLESESFSFTVLYDSVAIATGTMAKANGSAGSGLPLATTDTSTHDTGFVEMRATNVTPGSQPELKRFLTESALCSDDSTCAVYLTSQVEIRVRETAGNPAFQGSGGAQLTVKFLDPGIAPDKSIVESTLVISDINNSMGMEGRAYLGTTGRLIQFQVAAGDFRSDQFDFVIRYDGLNVVSGTMVKVP